MRQRVRPMSMRRRRGLRKGCGCRRPGRGCPGVPRQKSPPVPPADSTPSCTGLGQPPRRKSVYDPLGAVAAERDHGGAAGLGLAASLAARAALRTAGLQALPGAQFDEGLTRPSDSAGTGSGFTTTTVCLGSIISLDSYQAD